ncbi:hypothetical protein [Winogradskyella jejuensis]|uniref:Uncharacterized protein n=1 Tax=Winogradskyella jejuensis TaxID=1089305 RepID=A0A1M5N712_9FLAO|nr:hypothetical protein [Winogradskyella jejuensis]SHG85257.1 hypothetical protein SAMN05444148_1101 [Winogradskyella jejuensis]
MNFLIFLLQSVDIDQKLKEAPDNGYAIGVFIGTILPFLVLVAIAYAIYRNRKKRLKDN